MPKILTGLLLAMMLYWMAIRPVDRPRAAVSADGTLEVVFFLELPAKDGDDFRYCVVEIKDSDGAVRRVRLKAKKSLVAESIEGFAKSMLPW